MKRLILTAILIVASLATTAAKDYQISTPKTTIILSAEEVRLSTSATMAARPLPTICELQVAWSSTTPTLLSVLIVTLRMQHL